MKRTRKRWVVHLHVVPEKHTYRYQSNSSSNVSAVSHQSSAPAPFLRTGNTSGGTLAVAALYSTIDPNTARYGGIANAKSTASSSVSAAPDFHAAENTSSPIPSRARLSARSWCG